MNADLATLGASHTHSGRRDRLSHGTRRRHRSISRRERRLITGNVGSDYSIRFLRVRVRKIRQIQRFSPHSKLALDRRPQETLVKDRIRHISIGKICKIPFQSQIVRMSQNNPLVRKDHRVNIDLGMIDLLLNKQLNCLARSKNPSNVLRNVTAQTDTRRSAKHPCPNMGV